MFKVYFFLFVRREKEIIWIRGNMGMLNLLRVKLLRFKLYFGLNYILSVGVIITNIELIFFYKGVIEKNIYFVV